MIKLDILASIADTEFEKALSVSIRIEPLPLGKIAKLNLSQTHKVNEMYVQS